MTRRVGMVLFPILLIVGMVIFISYVNPSIHPVIQQQPVIADPPNYDSSTITAFDVKYREDGNDLVFSLSDLKEHRLVRFEYKTPTLTRPVMAYIAPDGRLVTAISVSEHCGSTEFKIKENKIYCARCPSYWDMMTMEAYACCAKYYPDPIPSTTQGHEVRIARDAVEKWAGRL